MFLKVKLLLANFEYFWIATMNPLDHIFGMAVQLSHDAVNIIIVIIVKKGVCIPACFSETGRPGRPWGPGRPGTPWAPWAPWGPGAGGRDRGPGPGAGR